MGKGGGGKGNPSDPTGKIGKQIGWCNKNAGLVEAISYADAVGPLGAIDIGIAMKILQDLAETGGSVRSPTNYVIAAANRASGQSGRPQSGKPARRQSFPSPDHEDDTKQISRLIGQLNKRAGLVDPISHSDVIGQLSSIGLDDALNILSELESKADSIKNPTAWVGKAAARLGGSDGSFGGGGGGHRGKGRGGDYAAGFAAGAVGSSKQISGFIGRLNKSETLVDQISYSDVIGPLSLIDPAIALEILEDVEAKASEIKNPTAYVAAAANRKIGGGGFKGGGGVVQGGEVASKISKQIGWLNNHVELVDPIRYTDVAEPLGLIDLRETMSILKDVETNAAQIKNPTAYVMSAASKRIASAFFGAGGGAVRSGGKGGKGGARKRARSDGDEDEERDLGISKEISKEIGRLNNRVGLLQSIEFNEVREPLAAVDLDSALKILQDLEARAGSVKDPTNYILVAAQRAASGEGPPAGKRPRLDSALQQDMGPGKTISSAIGRLNKTGMLAVPISYSEVKPALETIDPDAALKILGDLQNKAGQVRDPTNYILAAAKRV